MTLSGFDHDNPLRSLGDLNIWLNSRDYGLVEVGHQFILHNISRPLWTRGGHGTFMTSRKIITLDEMAAHCHGLKAQGKRVVLCHGTFDLMHAGHIRHLQRARQEGDALMVTVTGDAYVNKGPGRPVFNEQLRAENLAALACVDYVAINSSATAIEALHTIQPSIYAKGNDYRSHSDDVTGNIAREQAAAEAHGGQVFYTDEITFSSSSLLNEHFNVFRRKPRSFCTDFAAGGRTRRYTTRSHPFPI